MPTIDKILISKQADFRPGKNCTSKILHLTQHIEDGLFETERIIEAVFVDLSQAYDTINLRKLKRKVYELTIDVKFTRIIDMLLTKRRFYVNL